MAKSLWFEAKNSSQRVAGGDLDNKEIFLLILELCFETCYAQFHEGGRGLGGGVN